jgi:hypothetical protein
MNFDRRNSEEEDEGKGDIENFTKYKTSYRPSTFPPNLVRETSSSWTAWSSWNCLLVLPKKPAVRERVNLHISDCYKGYANKSVVRCSFARTED